MNCEDFSKFRAYAKNMSLIEQEPSAGFGLSSTRMPSVYLLDLWTFIPYYTARLWQALKGQLVNVQLGSVRYHLDREYFHRAGVQTDSGLIDFAGEIKPASIRRVAKTFEYLANLFLLGVRLPICGIDILHVQFVPFLERGFPFELWFLRWMRSCGTRIVYTAHNLADRDSRKGNRRLYEALYSRADAIVCHGQDVREKLINEYGIATQKLKVIPHGPLFNERPFESKSEARAKLGLPIEETLVLCAGVITEYKGIPFLLDAWKRQLRPEEKSRLLIAGTGDSNLLDRIRSKVESEGLTKSVSLWLRFISVDELPLLHQATDILVYPYKACTTSGALLTGLNYHKAMITTKLKFFQEVLKDGSESKMVDYGDVEGLASVLRELISSPQIRDKLARAIACRPESNASWSKIAQTTIECYQSLSYLK